MMSVILAKSSYIFFMLKCIIPVMIVARAIIANIVIVASINNTFVTIIKGL